MKHIIKIKDNEDGVIYEIHDDYDWSDDGIDYAYSEGNYSCDCNRRLFVEQSKKDTQGVDNACDLPCGHTRYILVSIDNVEYENHKNEDGSFYQTMKELNEPISGSGK